MKKRGLHIAEICVGAYFIASVFYAYFGDYNYLYELTSLSNLLNGVILIVCGILGLYQKRLNIIVNLMALVCIMCVYATVFMVAFNISQFNFDGGFMLLHGVKDTGRVEKVIAKVRSKAKEYGANPDMVEALYREMISRFVAIELTEFQKKA